MLFAACGWQLSAAGATGRILTPVFLVAATGFPFPFRQPATKGWHITRATEGWHSTCATKWLLFTYTVQSCTERPIWHHTTDAHGALYIAFVAHLLYIISAVFAT